MRNLILTLSTLFLVQTAFAKCIAPVEYVPFTGVAAKPGKDGQVMLGNYSRISPDGRFVLRSYSGDYLSTVTLMEIFKQSDGTKAARAYETDFNNEAFPVQGTWRFLVDMDGSHYRLVDLLKNQKDADKQFRGGIGGFYTAAAEFPGGTDSKILIRSLSWPNQHGGMSDQQGVGQLTNEIITVKKNSDGSYQKTNSDGPYSMCSNLSDSDGWSYSLPMISADASEFAALPQSPSDHRASMRVYKFGANNKDCIKEDDLNVPASKAIFGFSQTGKKAPLVFLASSNVGNAPVYGIHLYDRELKRTFYVGDNSKWVSPDAFPGMTRDGRVIYGAKWKDCASCEEKAGYVITDFYQSQDVKRFKQQYPDLAKGFKECITEDDVAKVEAEQSVMYGFK